jgi:hypothetical protein
MSAICPAAECPMAQGHGASRQPDALRDEFTAAGLSPRTVVRHLMVAHGLFKHALRTYGLKGQLTYT